MIIKNIHMNSQMHYENLTYLRKVYIEEKK